MTYVTHIKHPLFGNCAKSKNDYSFSYKGTAFLINNAQEDISKFNSDDLDVFMENLQKNSERAVEFARDQDKNVWFDDGYNYIEITFDKKISTKVFVLTFNADKSFVSVSFIDGTPVKYDFGAGK